MQEQPIIMVQVSDRQWTWDVLHNACAMAQACDGRIALVQLVRVQRIAYLGTEFGYSAFSEQEECALQAYADAVAEYGLECDLHLYQYLSLIHI